MTLSSLTDDARIAAASAADFASGLVSPVLRIGVTGLARAGKTVFITALAHNLIHGGRLPLLRPLAEGRIRGVHLEPQPDDAVPRFAYEAHLDALVGDDRHWPESTRQISELRLVIDYEPTGLVSRLAGRGRLAIDIVDYPGEWLLDLALLERDYRSWSEQAMALARESPRAALSDRWLKLATTVDPLAPVDEQMVIAAAERFTAYLAACRDEPIGLSTVPPGRFLLPGDLEGSPALTFAPLDLPPDGRPPRGSIWASMERRYEAYRDVVVRPFFRDHFARLDRQIVLVDALAALNAGPGAVADLERALTTILSVFRPGRGSLLTSIFRPRIDRILFAATKADHLHQTSHDRLGAVLAQLTAAASERAAYAGADVANVALAAVRATREAQVRRGGDDLACITGTPIYGERIGAETFDGNREAAVFPGDLPADPAEALSLGFAGPDRFGFVRFRPPPTEAGPTGLPVLPHIRLDRALDYLIADRLA